MQRMLIKQHLLDKRVVERALKKGLLDAGQYQRTIEQLPDASSNIKPSESMPSTQPGATQSDAPR
jgi:hypothetical protein